MGKTKKPEHKKEDSYLSYSIFIHILFWSYLLESTISFISVFDFSHFNMVKFLSLSLCISGVFTLLKPSSFYRSVPFLGLIIIDISIRLPYVSNHLFFNYFNLITILFCICYCKYKYKENFSIKKLYDTFSPPLRLAVIIIYFWATFHKLNSSFFDMEISCATVQIFYIKEYLKIFPAYEWLIQFNPYLTILVEGGIPLLLLFSKTRIIGVLVGVIFHFILGFGFPQFTLLVYSLYSLFIAEESYQNYKSYLQTILSKINAKVYYLTKLIKIPKSKKISFLLHTGYVILILLLLKFFITLDLTSSYIKGRSGTFIYLFLSLSILFSVLFVIKSNIYLNFKQQIKLIPKPLFLIILPLLIFINGLLPHIGVKNVQVAAMFSNLRTEEGKTNHLIIPPSFQLFNHLKDLVTIKNTNSILLRRFTGYTSNHPIKSTTILLPKEYIEYLKTKDIDMRIYYKYKIPYIKFQNLITGYSKSGLNNLDIIYQRNGKTFTVKNAQNDPKLSKQSIFKTKFFYLRVVPDDSRGLCMW